MQWLKKNQEVLKNSREVGTEKQRLKNLSKMSSDMFIIKSLVKCIRIPLVLLLKKGKDMHCTLVLNLLKVVDYLVMYFPFLLLLAECIFRSLRLTATRSLDTSSVKGLHHTVVAASKMLIKKKNKSQDFNFNPMLYFYIIIKILIILTEYTMKIFWIKMCTTREWQSRSVWRVKMLQTTNFPLLGECFSGRRVWTQFVLSSLAESFSARGGTCGSIRIFHTQYL